jgi:hypothetical protein
VAGRPRRRPRRWQSSQSPASRSRGSSAFTALSQPAHSSANFHGRVTNVSPTVSRRPARKPASPPLILAAAVEGSGEPTVARLKATHGPITAAAHAAKAVVRRQVTGPAAQSSASSSTASGRAGTARAARAAATRCRSRVCASRAAAARSAAKPTSIPESAPQSSGPASAVRTPARSAARRSPVQAHASRLASSAAPSAAAAPSALASIGWLPATAKTPARSSVQSGAVEPDTGTPGL